MFAPWLAWEGIQLFRNVDTVRNGVRHPLSRPFLDSTRPWILSIHLSIDLSIYLSIHPSIHPSIYRPPTKA